MQTKPHRPRRLIGGVAIAALAALAVFVLTRDNVWWARRAGVHEEDWRGAHVVVGTKYVLQPSDIDSSLHVYRDLPASDLRSLDGRALFHPLGVAGNRSFAAWQRKCGEQVGHCTTYTVASRQSPVECIERHFDSSGDSAIVAFCRAPASDRAGRFECVNEECNDVRSLVHRVLAGLADGSTEKSKLEGARPKSS
jgi:hypothetical protein